MFEEAETAFELAVEEFVDEVEPLSDGDGILPELATISPGVVVLVFVPSDHVMVVVTEPSAFVVFVRLTSVLVDDVLLVESVELLAELVPPLFR